MNRSFTVFLVLMAFLRPSAHAGMNQEITDSSDSITSYSHVDDDTQGEEIGGRWLPVPVPLSNPTIGTGLVASLLYLHPAVSESLTIPNATSGIAVMGADSGSKFAGIFHDGYYWGDKVRLRAAAGTGEFNLDFFGIGENPMFPDESLPYKIEGETFQIQALWQLGQTNYHLGLRETWIGARVSFDLANILPGLPEISGKSTTSSLAFVLVNDGRDDNYYPTHGHFFKGSFSKDSKDWGSDYSFETLFLSFNKYWRINDSMVLAGRLQASDLTGRAPFYLLPTLNLRGFPNGRYRGKSVFSTHLEFRHKLSSRWGYILFGEFGNTADTVSSALRGKQVTSAGAGIRWQVLSSKTLNLGIDYGVSGSDSAIYIKVGESF